MAGWLAATPNYRGSQHIQSEAEVWIPKSGVIGTTATCAVTNRRCWKVCFRTAVESGLPLTMACPNGLFQDLKICRNW